MTWIGFFGGAYKVLRITAFILIKIVLFILSFIFATIKFLVFFILMVLTLGSIGMDNRSGGKGNRNRSRLRS